MHFDESKSFGATVVGAITLWLGYNVGATGWGLVGAVALMALYLVIFQQEANELGTKSQSQRADELPIAQATTLAPGLAEPRIEAVNNGTRTLETARVVATDVGRRAPISGASKPTSRTWTARTSRDAIRSA